METLRPYSDTPNQSDLLPIPPWPAKYSQAHLRPSFRDTTRLAEEASEETHMPQSTKDAAAQVGSLSQFRDGNEPPDQPVKASTVRPAQQTHTSDVIRIQKRCRETRHQDLNTSKKSRQIQLRPMQLSSRLSDKRRRIGLLRKLQRSGEEVTFTTLSAAFELTGEVKDLFLTGGQPPEDLRHYFRQYFEGRGEIDAFLTAALGPEPTSHTAAFTYSQRVPRQLWHPWWASRHLSQRKTQPVRDPQADSKTSSELSHRYSKLPAARHGSAANLATSTSIARNLKHNTQRLPDEKMEQ